MIAIEQILTTIDREYWIDTTNLNIICIKERNLQTQRGWDIKWFPLHKKCKQTVNWYDGIFFCETCQSIIDPKSMVGCY